MTISSNNDPKAGPYNGNDSQTAFPFSFRAFLSTDLLVVRTDDDGVEYELTPGSDYSVSLNADQNANPGGTVTYPLSGDPLPDGETLTIVSDLEYLQPLNLPNGGTFSPSAQNNAFDRVTMLVKQVKEKVSRALQLAVSTPAGVNVTLPAPEGGHVIGWSADGASLANFAPDTSTSTAELEDRLADTSSASNGATLVGYRGRTLRQRLDDYPSIKSFCVCDGVTDDSAALVAAWVNFPILRVPANTTVRIGTKITNTLSKGLIGEDIFTSVIYGDVNDWAIDHTGSPQQLTIANLTIRGNLAHASGRGIRLFGPDNNSCENLRIEDFTNQGISLRQSVTGGISNVKVSNCGVGVEIDGGATFSVAPILNRVYVAGCDVGFDFTVRCVSLNMIGCVAENCTVGMQGDASIGGFAEIFFEACATNMILVDSSGLKIDARWNGTTHWSFTYTGAVPFYEQGQEFLGSAYKAFGGGYRDNAFAAATNNTWANVGLNQRFPTFNVNPNPGGVANTQIAILYEGLYFVDYFANVRNASGTVRAAATHLTLNGTEITGTYGSVTVDINQGVKNISRRVPVYCEVGDVIVLQYVTDDVTNCLLDADAQTTIPDGTVNSVCGVTLQHTGIVR